MLSTEFVLKDVHEYVVFIEMVFICEECHVLKGALIINRIDTT